MARLQSVECIAEIQLQDRLVCPLSAVEVRHLLLQPHSQEGACSSDTHATLVGLE